MKYNKLLSTLLISGCLIISTVSVSAETTNDQFIQGYEELVDTNVYKDQIITVADTKIYADCKGTRVVGIAPKHTMFLYTDVDTDWVYVESDEAAGYIPRNSIYSGENISGYIKEHLDETVSVDVSHLDVRLSDDYSSNTIAVANYGDFFLKMGETNDSYLISCNGEIGYVTKEYCKLSYAFGKARPLEIVTTYYKNTEEDNYTYSFTPKGESDIVDYASLFIGNPYVWGGTDLNNGVDCSGFVQQVFKHFGYTLPRVSRDQANYGTAVSLNDIRPGDLLFYGNNDVINHVAIYAGDGLIIHASNHKPYPDGGIKVSKYNYRKIYKVVRIWR